MNGAADNHPPRHAASVDARPPPQHQRWDGSLTTVAEPETIDRFVARSAPARSPTHASRPLTTDPLATPTQLLWTQVHARSVRVVSDSMLSFGSLILRSRGLFDDAR
jgi:hypothetical protein